MNTGRMIPGIIRPMFIAVCIWQNALRRFTIL